MPREFALLVLVMLSAGCASFPGTPPTAGSRCVPFLVDAVPSSSGVDVVAAFTNCDDSEVVVATQVCNAPWTNVTVRVVEMPRGRLPFGWGVLTGAGDSRALLERFVEECPDAYHRLAPGGTLETRTTWNGTFFRDPCSNGGAFSCPTWEAVAPGKYRFEAWAWPVLGGRLEARDDVEFTGGPS